MRDGAFEHVAQIAFVEEMRTPNGAIGRQIRDHLAPGELLYVGNDPAVTRVTHGDVELSLLQCKGDQRMGPGILLRNQAEGFRIINLPPLKQEGTSATVRRSSLESRTDHFSIFLDVKDINLHLQGINDMNGAICWSSLHMVGYS
jgi:hypothetical protein